MTLSDFHHEPGAEVAGKLAVSLVDAASVLEVLVAIVLVGEHLTTSLALIPSIV